MAITYTTSTDHIDWNHLAALFVRTDLGNRSPDLLETTFRGSQVTVFVHEDGRLIGAGRALSDHTLWSAIFDVAVDPTYQGKGIGVELVRRIREAAGTPNVMLKSAPGKEPFYAKLGFKPMPMGMEASPSSHGYDPLHEAAQR
jgi:GNAT superfamily N-acetyltransferase